MLQRHKGGRGRHLCPCVCNYQEVNVQPTIDFGKGSNWDDEEVCPVKWLLCGISCRWLILCALYSLLPDFGNSLGCISLGCSQLHSDSLFKKKNKKLTKQKTTHTMVCRCIQHNCSGSQQNLINCLASLGLLKDFKCSHMEIHHVPCR